MMTIAVSFFCIQCANNFCLFFKSVNKTGFNKDFFEANM